MLKHEKPNCTQFQFPPCKCSRCGKIRLVFCPEAMRLILYVEECTQILSMNTRPNLHTLSLNDEL